MSYLKKNSNNISPSLSRSTKKYFINLSDDKILSFVNDVTEVAKPNSVALPTELGFLLDPNLERFNGDEVPYQSILKEELNEVRVRFSIIQERLTREKKYSPGVEKILEKAPFLRFQYSSDVLEDLEDLDLPLGDDPYSELLRKELIERRNYLRFFANKKVLSRLSFAGSRHHSENVMYYVLNGLKNKFKVNPYNVIYKCVEKIKPEISLRPKKVAGVLYKIPVPLPEYQQYVIALKWISEGVKNRIDRKVEDRLLNELIDIYSENGLSYAFKKRSELYKIALANRPHTRYLTPRRRRYRYYRRWWFRPTTRQSRHYQKYMKRLTFRWPFLHHNSYRSYFFRNLRDRHELRYSFNYFPRLALLKGKLPARRRTRYFYRVRKFKKHFFRIKLLPKFIGRRFNSWFNYEKKNYLGLLKEKELSHSFSLDQISSRKLKAHLSKRKKALSYLHYATKLGKRSLSFRKSLKIGKLARNNKLFYRRRKRIIKSYFFINQKQFFKVRRFNRRHLFRRRPFYFFNNKNKRKGKSFYRRRKRKHTYKKNDPFSHRKRRAYNSNNGVSGKRSRSRGK